MSRTTRSRALVGIAAGALLLAGAVPLTGLTASASTDLLNTSGPAALFPKMCTDTIRVVLPPEYGDTATEPAQPCSSNVDPWLDGTTLDSYRDEFQRHPVLSWAPITDRTVTKYEVEISPDSLFTNIVPLPNEGFTTATQLELPQSIPHASYFWRVRAWNDSGEHTDWSGTDSDCTAGGSVNNDSCGAASVWQFTKSWFDYPTPIAASSPNSLNFSWKPMPDASAYEIQLNPDSTFDKNYTLDCITNHTNYTPYSSRGQQGASAGGCSITDTAVAKTVEQYQQDHQLPATSGQIYWRVRGINGTDESAITAVTGGVSDCPTADCSAWAFNPDDARQWQVATALPTGVPTGLSLPNRGSQNGSAVGTPVKTCQDTPTLSWNAPATGGSNRYLVDISWDPAFASIWREYVTTDTQLTPVDSFPDGQAGRTYYFRVASCFWDDSPSQSNSSSSSSSSSGGSSSSDSHKGLVCHTASSNTPLWDTSKPTAAFHKLSIALPSAPQTMSANSTPGTGSCSRAGEAWLGMYVTVNNAEHYCNSTTRIGSYASISLHWDYYGSYLKASGAGVTIEAKNYRVQLDHSPSFDNPITAVVDGNRWTKSDGLLSDGTWYWRVQPIDQSGNGLPWTKVMSFVKGPILPTAQIHGSGVLAPGSAVTIDISVPLNPGTVSSSTIGIANAATGATIAATVKLLDKATVVVVPNSPLLPGERVKVWTSPSLHDSAGNRVTAAADYRVVEPMVDSSSDLFAQSWERISDPGASGGQLVHSANWDDTLTFTFTGTAVTLVGRTGPNAGDATVMLDSGDATLVDFYAPQTTEKATVWSRAALGSGTHTVTVVVDGSHNSSSSGNDVAIDGFQVGGAMHEETDPGISMTWSTHRATDAVGGSYETEQSFTPSSATTASPAVQVSVYGSTVTVGACLSPEGGMADVYIDGSKAGTVDFYQGYTSCNATLFTSTKLADAPHTVRIVDTGTHRTASSGTKVSLDWVSVAS